MFEFIKAVSDTVLDMINALIAYHDKPLISSVVLSCYHITGRGESCEQPKKEVNPKGSAFSDDKPKPKVAIAGSLVSVEKPVKEDKNNSEVLPKPMKTPPPIPVKTLPPFPKEIKCVDRGTKKVYLPGQAWYGDDDCMHCTCQEDGQAACATPMCLTPFCATGPAIKIKGRCCQVCPDDVICKENSRAKIAGKERWQKDDCSLCHCTKSGVECVDPKSVNQTCPRKQSWNGNCEPICINDICKLKCFFLFFLFFYALLRGLEP